MTGGCAFLFVDRSGAPSLIFLQESAILMVSSTVLRTCISAMDLADSRLVVTSYMYTCVMFWI